MPDFVRVKSNETGAEFTVHRLNVTDAVTVLDDKPALRNGRPAAPKPHKNLRTEQPAVATSDEVDAPSEDTNKSARSGRRTAGKSGNEETS